MTSSDYINQERRDYAFYVLSNRAIPHASDGLKAATRRILWTARDGKKYKSATLAGATMPIHPHQSPEGAIDTITAPYGNNIPLLNGMGAFGTILNPTAYGQSRYTSVELSEFTKDVVLKDIEIIPMQLNYDNTIEEPTHFLPLIPLALLNPQQGIAVGFASDILPRDLADIINHQLMVLKGKGNNIEEPKPFMVPLDQRSIGSVIDKKGVQKWIFRGAFEKINATTIKITNLPYGIIHEKFISKLDPLIESGIIISIEDNSRNKYNIDIKFKKGVLSSMPEDEIVKMLGLETSVSEIFNVIHFNRNRIWSPSYKEMIIEFVNWRLQWYKPRYERLADLLTIDIQRYKDVLLAIAKNVGSQSIKLSGRSSLKEYLEKIGIVHVDYIADLPVYRFTQEEKSKTEKKLKEAEDQMKRYQLLISDENERKLVYASELKEILTKYNKGTYKAKM